MASIFTQLDTASFKGVPFLIPDETSTRGGRKTVTHEFVNSNKRVVEDLGLFRKVFEIKGIINNSDGQYFLKRNALLKVLDEGGEGILSHPFFGKVTVVADQYSVVERFKELGRADFSMKFKRANDKADLLPDAFTGPTVSAQKDVVVVFIGDEVVNNFRVRPAFPFNFSAVTTQLEAIGAAFDAVTTTFDRQLGEINEFTRVLNDFRNNTLSLAQSPQRLVNSLTNLYDAADALAQTPEEAFQTLEKFFVFGDDAPEIIPTTAELIERSANRKLLNQFMQVGALAFAYENASNIDFFTIREIDLFSAKLDAQYDKVFPELTNNDLASSLTELRVITGEFLDIQRLNVKKIIEFETGPTTLQELSYRLYGSVDDFERLASLNDIKDVDFISGSYEVFR
jgi:prophage DNA circulation protein